MLQLCSNNLLYKERMLMSVHGNNLSAASQNSAPYQHTVLTYSRGIFLTFVLALASLQLARLPYLSIVGALVLAILLGMKLARVSGLTSWRTGRYYVYDKKVVESRHHSHGFASQFA